jgi:hypothetical protein
MQVRSVTERLQSDRPDPLKLQTGGGSYDTMSAMYAILNNISSPFPADGGTTRRRRRLPIRQDR